MAARAAVVLPERSLLLLHEHQSHTRLAVGSVLGSLDFHPASLSETLEQQSRGIAAAKLRLPPACTKQRLGFVVMERKTLRAVCSEDGQHSPRSPVQCRGSFKPEREAEQR